MCDKSFEELKKIIDDLYNQMKQAWEEGSLERYHELKDQAVFLEIHVEQFH